METIKAIIFILTFFLLVFASIYGSRHLRSFRLRKFAINNRLDFVKNFSFIDLMYPKNKNLNLIQGDINGYKIKFYDSSNQTSDPTAQELDLEKYSVLIINDSTKIQTKRDFLSVRDLKLELLKLVK